MFKIPITIVFIILLCFIGKYSFSFQKKLYTKELTVRVEKLETKMQALIDIQIRILDLIDEEN